MATFQEATIQQGTYEIRKWTADFTNDLPTSVTVASGTAVHTPPSGTAATLTISAASPYLSVTLGPLTVTGVHYLDFIGTFSNGEVSQVRVSFPVNYTAPTARAGMSDLIGMLRGYTDAGPNDYAIAGVAYWSDAQLQTVMDRNRKEFFHQAVSPMGSTVGGTVQYYRYETGIPNQESGTAVFKIQDVTGTTYNGTAYSADYLSGIITWNSDTLGSSVYFTGRSYDLNAAASDVWRHKAVNVAKAYDFSTDNHRVARSQMFKQFMEMSSFYGQQAGPVNVSIYRSDVTVKPKDNYDLD
jgi:hypothetical protein